MINILIHEFDFGDALAIGSTFLASVGFLVIILYFLRPRHPSFKYLLLIMGMVLVIMTSPSPMIADPIILPNIGGITGIVLIILRLRLHFQKSVTLPII